jgi:hypothetical protein
LGNDEDVTETFSALDGLARLSAHIPDQWEPMVRYYGWYSNRQRGERKKAPPDPSQSVPIQNPESESDFKKETGSPTASVARRHGARLIKKVYAVDPLIGPNGSGRLRIIRFMEDAIVIERILRPLGLWPVAARIPRAPPAAPAQITLDYRVADEPAAYD